MTFNGLSAPVTFASSTQIVTSVPAGATTGPIVVTTPVGSATSSTPFTVSNSAAPTIASFTPTIGTPGTTLTITGTNFETVPSNDRVTFNNRYALVNSATSTEISTSVPNLATSGRVSVATPAGKAVSAADFFVPPTPFAAADVEVTGRMALGESKIVTIGTANKIGLILFDGVAGQRVSLQISSSTFTGCLTVSDTIKKPDGTNLASTDLCGATGYIDTLVLPVTGTYTILIDPHGTTTGSQTLVLNDVPADATSTGTVGGSAVTVTTTVPGQNATVTFSGTAAQQITVTLTNNSMGTVTAKLLKPDGSQLTSKTSSSSSFTLGAPRTLPTTGTYTVSIDASGTATGSLTVTIKDVAADLALNKTATQSSTNWSAPANRAVDGNTDGDFWNGSVTTTQVESQPWWQVDLGSVQSIGNIDIWNRTDCCAEALTNFYVFVSDDPFASTDLASTQNQTGVSSYQVPGQGGTPTTVNANRTGRYVRVQLVGQERLSLAEVEVWPTP